jgi:ABC-type polysaccharide/polyol phosphate transport system ATPase subunit
VNSLSLDPLTQPAQDIARQPLIALQALSKSYRLWHRPYERLFYGIWNQVPAFAPGWLRRTADHQKARLGEEVFALSEVTLSISKGESVGIIGRNGSGKSTLLHLIAGVLQPTSGSAKINAKRVTALLELGSGFDPNFTGRQNVLLHGSILGLSEEENFARLDEVVSFSEIDEAFDWPVKTYSSGMAVRLAFASSITARPDLLIVDEALAVGDIFFQQKCFQRIRELVEKGVTILLVSHDMRSINEFCENTLVLHHGKSVFFGPSNQAINEYYRLTKPPVTVEGTPTYPVREQSGDSVGLDSGPALEPIPEERTGPAGGAARFVGFTLLDERGEPCRLFRQGSWVTIVFDLKVFNDIENVSAGIMLRDDRGAFLHGKHHFQADFAGLRSCRAGEVVRWSVSMQAVLSAGQYTISLDLVRIPAYAIRNGKLSFADYDQSYERISVAGSIGAFDVTFDTDRPGSEFSHIGVFDLPYKFSVGGPTRPIDVDL